MSEGDAGFAVTLTNAGMDTQVIVLPNMIRSVDLDAHQAMTVKVDKPARKVALT